MTPLYLTRKLAQRCTYASVRPCTEEPEDGNGLCARHAEDHRRRNRRWKLRSKVQLRFEWPLST